MLLALLMAFSPGLCCCALGGTAKAAGAEQRKSCCAAAEPVSNQLPAPGCASRHAPGSGDERACHCHDETKAAPGGGQLKMVPASGGGNGGGGGRGAFGLNGLVPLAMPPALVFNLLATPDPTRLRHGLGRDPHPPPLSLLAQHCMLLI